MRAYRALYYGFGCTPALRWKRYLPGNFTTQVIFAKSNGNCLAYHEIPKNGSTTVKSLLLDAVGHPVPASSDEVHRECIRSVHRFRHPVPASSDEVHRALHHSSKPHLPWRQPASADNYLIIIRIVNNLPPLLKIPPEFDHAFHFAFVRNPWARLVSCYANKVLALLPRRFADFRRHYPLIRFERMTFTDFVRFVCRVPDDLCDKHFAPQCRFLDGNTLDFVGRVERFADDLSEIIRLGGLDERLLKWAHVKRHRSSTAARNLDKRAHIKTMLSSRVGHGQALYYTDLYTTQTRNLVARKYAKDIDRFGYRFGD